MAGSNKYRVPPVPNPTPEQARQQSIADAKHADDVAGIATESANNERRKWGEELKQRGAVFRRNQAQEYER